MEAVFLLLFAPAPVVPQTRARVWKVLGGAFAFQVLTRCDLLPEQGGDLILRKTGFLMSEPTAASGAAGLQDGQRLS